MNEKENRARRTADEGSAERVDEKVKAKRWRDSPGGSNAGIEG